MTLATGLIIYVAIGLGLSLLIKYIAKAEGEELPEDMEEWQLTIVTTTCWPVFILLAAYDWVRK